MRLFLTAALCLLPLLSGAQGEKAQPIPPSPAPDLAPAENPLLGITAHFTGNDALDALHQALLAGHSPLIEDSSGNTPLLCLCEALEMDYRYRTDPHFAQAVDASIDLLLRHGADALHENKLGCNAVFYLQSKPLLLHQLKENKLLPKDLAVRIPYEPAALSRYIRLRLGQAECTTHQECMQYLIRRYCTPAYDRAFDLLQRYTKSETAKKIPPQALPEILSFLRLADAGRIEGHINNLPLWEHGEHFLEEVPGLFLSTLNQLEWKVKPEQLRKALHKLGSMLPRSPEEMIDCHASLPMGHILEMLYRQEGAKALPVLRQYASSRDPELAYRALRLLLHREHLPLPEPEELAKAFGLPINGNSKSLPPLQRRLYECILVDSAIRLNDFSQIDADMLRRVQEAWRDMGLPAQADVLTTLLQDGAMVSDPYALHAARNAFLELPAPSPRMVIARYILGHPEMFTQPQQKAEP